MTSPRSVSEVIAEHVTFEVECIDRMYLNVYVPGLQYAAGLVGYVHPGFCRRSVIPGLPGWLSDSVLGREARQL